MNSKQRIEAALSASAKRWALTNRETKQVRMYFFRSTQTSREFDLLTPRQQAVVDDVTKHTQRQETT